jgi:hypothetical protein
LVWLFARLCDLFLILQAFDHTNPMAITFMRPRVWYCKRYTLDRNLPEHAPSE